MKIAFLADIHSNIHALTEVLKKIKSINVKEIWCCGDIVGYNAFPKECIALLKENNIKSIKGNHDQAVVDGNTYFFNELGIAGVNFNRKVLDKDDKNFLNLLSYSKKFNYENIKFYITHGSPRNNLYEYVYPWSTEEFLKEIAKGVEADVIVLGHTHIQMEVKVENLLFLNPGSVGQPRDSNPKACFMVFDSDTKKAEWFRVAYDIEAVTKANIKNNLPIFSSKRLYLGR